LGGKDDSHTGGDREWQTLTPGHLSPPIIDRFIQQIQDNLRNAGLRQYDISFGLVSYALWDAVRGEFFADVKNLYDSGPGYDSPQSVFISGVGFTLWGIQFYFTEGLETDQIIFVSKAVEKGPTITVPVRDPRLMSGNWFVTPPGLESSISYMSDGKIETVITRGVPEPEKEVKEKTAPPVDITKRRIRP